jgi:hypothetical protein
VTQVYVDLDLITTGGTSGGNPDRGAVHSLDYLIEAGHRVALVADHAVPVGLGELASTVVGAAPSEPESTAWYLTSDPDRCRGRSARLRTVLVGRTQGPAAIHRCDSLARDVLAAVLEILAAEAMPSA